jgi:integrase
MHLTKTKGRGSRYVGVLPDLMEKTREYIEGTRLRVVERWRRKRQSGYSEPVEIFLSHKTGRSLELRAITNLLTELFDKAGVKGHGHRLRAVFLTRLFEAEYEAQAALVAARARNTIDWDLILTKVAERAGHRDPQSLRAYVTTLKKRRARAATDGDVVPIRQYKTALVNEIAVLQHRRDALIGTKKPRSSGTANSS